MELGQNNTVRAQLHQMVTATMPGETANATVPQLFPPFIHIPATGEATPLIPVSLGLRMSCVRADARRWVVYVRALWSLAFAIVRADVWRLLLCFGRALVG